MSQRNPFPAQPVATMGVPMVKTCEDLKTVRRARQELLDYLSAYAKDDTRYGGAVALAGGHGSGKTHLLLHLAETGRNFTSFRVGSVYAKPDDASLFNVYKQAVLQVGRAGLIGLLDSARRGLAMRDVEQTRITESISSRIANAPDLQALYEDGSLDADALENTLDDTLHAEGIPADVIQAVKLCATSSGDKAFQWLIGSDTGELDILGLPRPLRQTEEASTDISGEDNVAIDGLVLLAMLYRLAGSPFLILIDQFDTLIAPDVKQRVLFSTIKTLIERVGSQNALIFFAGSEAAWRSLPPDVSPRLLTRTPLPVGALDRVEIAMLIDALVDKRNQLSDEALVAIDDLTGGNPREVLAIAFQLFKRTSGKLNRATAKDVADCALLAGTVDDMANLALRQTDEVIHEFGPFRRNLVVGDGVSIDRVIRKVAAVLLVKAADDIDETVQALNLSKKIGVIRNELPGAAVIAVTVGYTSTEVQQLFKASATVIPFDDRNYKGKLKAELVRIDESAAAPQASADDHTTTMLKTIAERIESLETRRREEADKAQQRFSRDAAKAVEPELKQRELKTRWQLLEELDRVEEATLAGSAQIERQSIQSILINNESYRKDRVLDQLGASYLDVLSVQAGSMDTGPSTQGVIRVAKAELLADMRARLRAPKFMAEVVGHPLRYALLVGALGIIVSLLLSVLAYYTYREKSIIRIAADNLPWSSFITTFAAFMTYMYLFSRDPSRSWPGRIAEMRKEALTPPPPAVPTTTSPAPPISP